MNIWILNHYASGAGAKGGTRHLDLSKELLTKGHSITIFTSNFNHSSKENEYNLRKSKVINNDGVDFYYIKTPAYKKNNIFRLLNMLVYTVKTIFIPLRIKDKPDIIIGSLVHPGAVMSAYILSRILNVPFYFEERDLWPQSIVDITGISESNPIIKMLYKLELFFYRKAKRIIVLFEPAVKYIESKGIPNEKVIYLPNGTVLDRAKSKKSTHKNHIELYDKLNDKFIITYLGSHGKANYLESILELAKMMEKEPLYQFVLIGEGTEKQKLIKESNDMGLENIHFLSSIDKEEIGYFLDKSSAGIITIPNLPIYKWGISPNKIYDYLGAGLPVIMQFSHENNIISNNNAGIVSDDIKEIAKKMRNLSSNEYEVMSKNATRTAKEFDWSVLANNFELVLKEDIQPSKMKN